MSTVHYSGPENVIDIVEKNGYFVLKNFFKREAVEKCRADLLKLLDEDEERRKSMGGPAVDNTIRYRSIYTKLMHTLWFPSLQAPRYLELVNDLLNSDVIKSFMKALAGDNYRMRVDLIRRSSGDNDFTADFQLPHVWHRDTLGEFTFGIFFDDLPESGAGGTAVVPGTHWDARDPRWDLMLGETLNMSRKHYLGNRDLLRLPDDMLEKTVYNKMVSKWANKRKDELCGQMGDIYFFLNDTWHGRAPNITGNRWMISRFGGFGTEFPFKDDVPLPDNIGNLEGPLARSYDRNPISNTDPTTLLRRMTLKRKPNLLTKMAAKEKTKLLEQYFAEPEFAKARRDLIESNKS